MVYNEILSKGLVTKSLADVVFGEDEMELMQKFFLVERMDVAYNVSMFYTAILQAYGIGRLIKNGVTLSESGYPIEFINRIKEVWVSDATNKSGKVSTNEERKEKFFSFVYVGYELVKDVNERRRFHNAYKPVSEKFKKHGNNRNETLLRDEGFLEYLQTLPLLRTTDIDLENNKFIFHPNEIYGNDETFEIDCRPFLNVKVNEDGEKDIYVTSAVKKGDDNGVLVFNYVLLNCMDSRLRTFREDVRISQNETMRMICKFLEIKTDWYPVEEYWCDLAFIQRLAEVTQNAIFDYSNKSIAKNHKGTIKKEMAKLFLDSDITADIERKEDILVDEVKKTIIGFYINYGIFKTTYALFLDHPDDLYGCEIFELFIKHLREMNNITENIDLYIADCDCKIDEHLVRLKSAGANEDSFQFKNRSREIKAEWRAFTVLKIAGVRADNLFLDREAIYSIDDYYDMFKNASIPLEDNLRAVLSLLNEVYGALLMNSESFDDKKFYSDIKRLRKENKNKSFEQLYNDFESIIERSEGHPCTNRFLGRSEICCLERIQGLKNDVIEAVKNCQDRSYSSILSKKYVFISYTHSDEDKVMSIVDTLKRNGINVFIDRERFEKGYDWRIAAQRGINDPDCVGVLAFLSPNSIRSEAVAFEIEHGYVKRFDPQWHPDLVGRKRDNFVLAVNIYDTSDMGAEKGFLCQEAHNENESASKIYSYIHGDVICYKSKKEGGIDELVNDMKERIGRQSSDYICVNDYSEKELDVANFFAVLKYGTNAVYQEKENVDKYFYGRSVNSPSIIRCIYPIIASMKEAKIKRDNITMLGYEMVGGGGNLNNSTKYILTSKPLMNPDDYYCLPNYQTASDDCSWMADPFLISHRRMYEDEN